MRIWRGLCLAAVGTLIVLPAWSAVHLDDKVVYLSGAQPDETACGWEPGIVSAVAARSNGAIVPASKGSVDESVKLTVEVRSLKLERNEKKGNYDAIVRANLFRSGKLVATRDFQNDESYKVGKATPCEALAVLGTSLGKEVSDWVVRTPLAPCGDDCAGIHPDEPIVVGAEVLVTHAESVNDTVRQECSWLTDMVKRLARSFNEDRSPTPRAKLEPRAIDIQKYPGRRLVLRVNEMHALGGGGWSGPKWLSMSGELYDGKLLVGSFQSYTTSGRGFTTCRSVDSLSDHTVEMVADWLISPTLNADLR